MGVSTHRTPISPAFPITDRAGAKGLSPVPLSYRRKHKQHLGAALDIVIVVTVFTSQTFPVSVQ